MMAINVALIGYGLAGAVFHAPLIAAEPRLKLSRIVTSRAEAARAFPDAIVSASAEAAFTDDAVHLVVIATPNKTHCSLAREALLAGKHVVVDKPFALDAREGADLIYLARDRGRMISPFHNRRWDGDFLTVQHLIRSDQLGEIFLTEMHWDRFTRQIQPGWREVPGDGSGTLANLGPHLVDQAIRLFGYPDAIAGDVASQRIEALVDDYFAICLHYGARRVTLSASNLILAPRPRFVLHGTKGSFVKHGIDPQEAVLRAGGEPHQPGYGQEDPGAYGILTDGEGGRPIPTKPGDWRIYYERVAEAILLGRAPPVDPADAVAGLSIIDNARRSAREGRLLRFSLPNEAAMHPR